MKFSNNLSMWFCKYPPQRNIAGDHFLMEKRWIVNHLKIEQAMLAAQELLNLGELLVHGLAFRKL